MVRGGSWLNNSNNTRAANRNNNTPDNRNDNLGFRCVALPGMFLSAKCSRFTDVGCVPQENTPGLFLVGPTANER